VGLAPEQVQALTFNEQMIAERGRRDPPPPPPLARPPWGPPPPRPSRRTVVCVAVARAWGHPFSVLTLPHREEQDPPF